MRHTDEFEHVLTDGRAILVECDDFQAADSDVGLQSGPNNLWLTLDGTGFPLSYELLPVKDQDAIIRRACDRFDDYCAACDYDD